MTADRKQLAAIDLILDRKEDPPRRKLSAPLLMQFGDAAKFLGVSRATVWRMIKVGRLQKIEILPSSCRVRREDVERIAGYNEDGVVAS